MKIILILGVILSIGAFASGDHIAGAIIMLLLVGAIVFNKRKKQEPTSFTTRQGKSVPVDDAFRAWTSADLKKMLKAVAKKTNPIDRHFLLQSIVDETYKLRKEDKYRKLCIEYAEKHLHEFPAIAPVLKEDMDGTLPRITTFQKYATVLTENGEFDKAVLICKEALKYGLHDNTKSGFEGRISRIRNEAKKVNTMRTHQNT